MARIIRFYIPDSYQPASRYRYAQGSRGKLIQFPPVAYAKLVAARAKPVPRRAHSLSERGFGW